MSGLDTSGWTKQDWLLQRYKYEPSEPAAIAFAAAFGLTTVVHLLQLLRSKTWYFIPFFVGGLFEVVGYVLRAMDATQAEKLLFINQTTLILLAPALYAASIYMILKRIFVLLEAESYSLVSVRWLTRFFVGCDILSFLTQGAGGAMSASTSTTGKPGNKELGKWLIVVGLCLQLAAFSFFIVVIGIFHYRVRRQPTTKSRTIVVPWQRYLVVLYGASTIVVIRSVFRLIEYIQGRDGYLMGHEVYAYVFDAAMMLILSIEFNIFHPSQIVSRRTKTKTMEEVSE